MALKYEDIKPEFLTRLSRDQRAAQLMSSIESGTATYATATQYAARVGEILGQVLKFNAPITDISDWDIDDLIPGSLGLDHRIVTNACRVVQETMNRDAGIGIRYQEPTFDWDRVHGIVDELRDNPEFINIEETFYDQITNFSQNVVDSSVRANASIASGAGIKTYVIRTASANACQWCQDAAGQYDYESVKNTGDPVWLRHENCNCTIDYVTERNGSAYRERVYERDTINSDTDNALFVSHGAISGAYNDTNDPWHKKRDAQAERMYAEFKNRDKGGVVRNISLSANVDIETATKAYEHLFENQYELDGGYRSFDPDYDMAQSLQRLLSNTNVQEHDVIMVLHEAMEHDIMQERGVSYDIAHRITQETYDYHSALMKWKHENGYA